jgi:dTDP-4-dehydrorhamnose 3,5-epimerase
MRVFPTSLNGVLLFEPSVFADERGYFMESYSQRRFDEVVGSHHLFVQDNHSRSAKGVLRGLHYQVAPHTQGKLVWVTRGAVFDVAADVNPQSPTFGRWFGTELSGGNHRQLWIPAGFAHGFLALTETADLLYKTTAYYEPSAERSVRWNDPTLAITWPLEGATPTLSPRDAESPFLA